MIIGALMAAAMSTAMPAPGALPADIHPDSMSRLPVIDRASLDAEGQRVYDAIRGSNPSIGKTGPSAVTMYSAGVAEQDQAAMALQRFGRQERAIESAPG